MLFNSSKIKGFAIAASDGSVGKVIDLLFDDANWQVRWLVVQTGGWLSNRKVLLAASALGHADQFSEEFQVKLTVEQVKDSPDIDTDRPVSRQAETDLYTHYGWAPYWGGIPYVGLSVYAHGLSSYPKLQQSPDYDSSRELLDARREAYDPHLRSVSEVIGYHLHATDGSIGHIEDMIVDEADWTIHYMVIDTQNWWPGKRVLISPRSLRHVGWLDRHLTVGVDRASVRNSPLYDPEIAIDRDYEDAYDSYYRGLPVPTGPIPDGMPGHIA